MESENEILDDDLVYLKAFSDAPNGQLFIGEGLKHVPFEIKRFYFINKLENPKAIRGKHAHKELEQIMFCANGSFEMTLDDGEKVKKFYMNNPSVGLRLRSRIWHEMSKFSPDCVILVVTSDYHDENDYIRDYAEFLKHVKKQ
ncbi:MAG TPA: FdtA/QdtA family cupin domain-containing protein [Candidatus Paceibacterota bacterium]